MILEYPATNSPRNSPSTIRQVDDSYGRLFSREGRRKDRKGRTRELLKRYYARHTLSRNQQFQFGLLDLVVRDTLTQLRTERERERGRERERKRERDRVSRVRLCKAVMSCLIVLSLFVPPHRSSASFILRTLVFLVIVSSCVELCASGPRAEKPPLSLSLSLSSISIVAPVLRCWQPPSPLSPCRVPRMLGIVSGIVLAYPLTSYLWDSNVRKIDTGTPLFAYGDSPDGPQGITVA